MSKWKNMKELRVDCLGKGASRDYAVSSQGGGIGLMAVLFFMVVAFAAISHHAFADTVSTTEIQVVMCAVIKQLTGPIGKAIAIIIVISMAIALFLGKVNWGLALAVFVGLGLLFGAESVVTLVTGGGGDLCAGVSS